ncbi:MAG: insulinase family protein [Clostridia bacterium]|nr:insulinase family protein [Clostridia bacterium]
MESKEICRGVNLHIINAPKFKTNLMSVFFSIPLKRETITRAALLPSVLKRGCKKYPTLKDMSRRLDDLYSTSLSGGTRMKGDGEVLYFTAEYVSDKYISEKLTPSVAEFLKDYLFSPLTENGVFLQEFVDSEKTNLKNAILGLINDKKEYAEVKCRETMFGQEGYGMFEIGYAEDLDDITPSNLYDLYQKILSEAKVDIIISGSVDEEIVRSVTQVLVPLFPPREADYISTEIAEITDAEPKNVTESADVVQSKLCMGLRCGVDPVSDEYYALMLGSCIFGGSPFSKLFNNVREKLSLAYYAVAKTSRFKSVMMISSGIQTENFQAAYDEIMVQLNKMKKGEIEDFEIDAAKKYLTNSYNSLNDSLRGMEDYYLSQAIMGTSQSVDDLLDKLMQVDKQSIVAVMQKIKLDTIYFLKGKTAEEDAQ